MYNAKKNTYVMVEFTVLDWVSGDLADCKSRERLKFTCAPIVEIAALDKLLETRPNATLVYSMWSDYREKDDIKRLLEIFERRKCPIITLHTSGHADSDAIQKLIDTVKPKETIYVHKEA